VFGVLDVIGGSIPGGVLIVNGYLIPGGVCIVTYDCLLILGDVWKVDFDWLLKL